MVDKINNFYDLEAYKKSHNWVLEIYKLTKKFPKEELFGMTSQLRRASSSVTANIAEGFGRYHFKDKSRFYYHSRGSLYEVQSFLLLSNDLGFIDKKERDVLMEKADEIARLLNGLIRANENKC